MSKEPKHITEAKELIFQFDTLTAAKLEYSNYSELIKNANFRTIFYKEKSSRNKIISKKILINPEQKLTIINSIQTLINERLKEINKYISILSEPSPRVRNYVSAILQKVSNTVILIFLDNNKEIYFLEPEIQKIFLDNSTTQD